MTVRSLNIAATGMVAQQYNVDVIAHNIANTNTTGYKESRPSFEDLIYQTDARMGAITTDDGARLPTGTQFGLGVAVGAISKNFQQGALTSTPGAPLNLAINGRGFFMVTMPNGEIAYTRDGSFEKNSEGQIVNNQGYIISPGITIPDNAIDVTITQNGEVQVRIPNQIEPESLGTFEMSTFNNPAGLEAIGGNLYLETPASGAPVQGEPGDEGFGLVKQYYLEASNVNSITEITDLIKAQRNFEMNSKVIQSTEQMLRTAIDTKA